MTTRLPLAVMAAVMFTVPGSLKAQQMASPCNQLAALTRMLRAEYGESAVAVGQQSDGHLLRIFASDAGTWSAVSIAENGWSCIVAAGKRWKILGRPGGEPATGPLTVPQAGIAPIASPPKTLVEPAP
jgi:hypothetical protein